MTKMIQKANKCVACHEKVWVSLQFECVKCHGITSTCCAMSVGEWKKGMVKDIVCGSCFEQYSVGNA